MFLFLNYLGTCENYFFYYHKKRSQNDLKTERVFIHIPFSKTLKLNADLSAYWIISHARVVMIICLVLCINNVEEILE